MSSAVARRCFLCRMVIVKCATTRGSNPCRQRHMVHKVPNVHTWRRSFGSSSLMRADQDDGDSPTQDAVSTTDVPNERKMKKRAARDKSSLKSNSEIKNQPNSDIISAAEKVLDAIPQKKTGEFRERVKNPNKKRFQPRKVQNRETEYREGFLTFQSNTFGIKKQPVTGYAVGDRKPKESEGKPRSHIKPRDGVDAVDDGQQKEFEGKPLASKDGADAVDDKQPKEVEGKPRPHTRPQYGVDAVDDKQPKEYVGRPRPRTRQRDGVDAVDDKQPKEIEGRRRPFIRPKDGGEGFDDKQARKFEGRQRSLAKPRDGGEGFTDKKWPEETEDRSFDRRSFNDKSGKSRAITRQFYSDITLDHLLHGKLGKTVFTQEDYKNAKEPVKTLFDTMEEKEVEEAHKQLPFSAFEEQMQWTKEGKLWHFPIDNDQGWVEEDQYSFQDHVFFDEQLKDFPKKGPVRHFMELVTHSLAKNYQISVKDKHDTIEWYKNYFLEHEELLMEKFGEEGAIKREAQV